MRIFQITKLNGTLKRKQNTKSRRIITPTNNSEKK